jgi:hypothetical protein
MVGTFLLAAAGIALVLGWLWTMFIVLGDLFRRQDVAIGNKVLWPRFSVVLPCVGALGYMMIEHGGMTDRAIERLESAQAELNRHGQAVASKAKSPG